MGRKAWENRAAAKKIKLQDTIPIHWRLSELDRTTLKDVKDVTKVPQQYMTDDELFVTESDVITLLENIHTGVWSAVQVTEAFCHRAAIAHQLVNCLTETLFEAAIRDANELDAFRLRTGRLKGPLHGLPVSFMDRYRIAGVETACGYISWLGKHETMVTESLIVKQTRGLGAIPYCKTNVPMSMMLGETDNNIIGSTQNPFARHLSSGGAAGGEGALLAMRGSCVGWGTDIAGSVRIPASFGNVYGLKPSYGRFPTQGVASSSPAAPLCEAAPGILSRDVASLKLVCKAMLTVPPVSQDASLLDVPWREAKYAAYSVGRTARRRPTFGVFRCDDHVSPHPPIVRALDITVAALERAGYDVVPWSPPPHEPAVRTLFQILGADGLAGVRNAINQSGEPPVSQLKSWYHQTETGSMTVAEFWSLCQKRTDYQKKYQEYWNTTEVDGVIMPVGPSACAEQNQMAYFGYTAIANLLDYSAGAFPVGFADRHIDVAVPAKTFLSRDDERIHTTYDPNIYHGAPVGLQIMCQRLEEEKVIALMEVIQTALN